MVGRPPGTWAGTGSGGEAYGNMVRHRQALGGVGRHTGTFRQTQGVVGGMQMSRRVTRSFFCFTEDREE